MARALTKMKVDGTLYVRPPEIERQIDEALSLGILDLRQRLLVADKSARSYLQSETLVHLMRMSVLENRPEVSEAVLPILLTRCEKNLEGTVSAELRDAYIVREEILGDFVQLLALDSRTETGELDFYECRFNRAFAFLRMDAVRRALTRLKYEGEPQSADLPEDEMYGRPDNFLEKLAENLQSQDTHERAELRRHIIEAIKSLPRDERKAVVLVHVFGYQRSSEDPNEITAATRCKCTPKTIFNRLQRAEKKLTALKEYV